MTLRVYELADGARVTTTVPARAGEDPAVFRTSRRAGVIRIETAARSPWQVLLVGVHVAGHAEGGAAAPHEQGTLIRASGQAVTVKLPATGPQMASHCP